MAVPKREPFDEHLARVATISAAGAEIPSEWTALRDRFLDFSQLQTPARDRLADAILTGRKGDDIGLLRAAAYSEAVIAQPQYNVNRAIADAVLQQLVEIYSPVSRENYQRIADRYNAVGAEFAAAAGAVDIEADAEQVIRGSEQERAAWGDGPVIGARLDGFMGPLRAAAELCGVSTKSQEVRLALAVDPGNAHRRAVWSAWEKPEGRAGRWTAILACGARIVAADIDTLTGYRRPLPLVEKMREINGLLVRETIDPEDSPDTPKPGPRQAVSA